ncbi:MAG: hypothetical protein J5647_02175, partial [Spirochaetaceae bacterium]|nr:hypothetical protein [Spirochaetaceae bacterium]
MLKFSDFAADDEKPLEGEKERIDNILNKEIIISAIKITASKYKDHGDKCATVQFYEESDARKRIFFTGSAVIIEQLEKYGEKLPFMTTVTKIDK